MSESLFNVEEKIEIQTAKNILSINIRLLINTLPEVLSNFLYDNAILTGGSISSTILKVTPNDYDLYLNDDKNILFFKQFVNNIDPDLIQDVNEKYTECLIQGKLITANATTFKNGLQVITMCNADARDTFDFVHCMPWYKLSDNKLFISRNQYDSIKQKKLFKNEKHSTPLSYKRIEKYTSRGWRFG